MSVEKNKESVRRFMQAFEEGDLDTVNELVDVKNLRVWTGGDLPFSGWRGFDEMMEQAVTMLYPQLPNGIKFIGKDIIAEGNKVAWELESDADHWSGQKYHNVYHFKWTFNDEGKIIEFKEYLDTAHAADILGRKTLNLPPETVE